MADNHLGSTAAQGAEPIAQAAGDWRAQLSPSSRERIVNKIVETLKSQFPSTGQEGLEELKRKAISFEESIYAASTSQPDYLRKISVKVFLMEYQSPNVILRSLTSNSSSDNYTPPDSGGVEPSTEETDDWRTQLAPDSRQRVVNKIMETLKKHFPSTDQERLEELKNAAVRFEESIYTSSTSQAEYVRKISVKMLTQFSPLPSNTSNNYNRPLDSGDTNNQRHTASQGIEPSVEAADDWRTQLPPGARQRIVNKMMETLKKHLPYTGEEGLEELRKVAVHLEEKICTISMSQTEYLRKISLKMLTVESK